MTERARIDLRERYLDVGGVSTRVLECGDSAARGSGHHPFVLLHGGEFGSYALADDWGPVLPLLAADRLVVAPDCLGCGGTENPPAPQDYRMGAVVTHVRRFLEVRGLGPAHLVGHSRGGYVATRLAVDAPELVASLTMVASGSLFTDPNPVYDDWAGQARQLHDPLERVRFLLEANSYSGAHLDDHYIDTVVAVLASERARAAADVFTGEVRAAFLADLDRDRHALLGQIVGGGLRCPTLLVWGFDDPSARIEHAGVAGMGAVLAATADAEFHVLNRAGHYCFRERPAAFTAVVRDFVRRSERCKPSAGSAARHVVPAHGAGIPSC